MDGVDLVDVDTAARPTAACISAGDVHQTAGWGVPDLGQMDGG